MMNTDIMLPLKVWTSILLFTFIGFVPEEVSAWQSQEVPALQENRTMTKADLQDMFYKTEIEQKISVEFKNVTVEQALRKLARTTGLSLNYRRNIMVDGLISLKKDDITISEALAYILDGTGLDYMFSRGGYLLIIRAGESPGHLLVQETFEGQVVDGVTGEPLPGVTIIIAGTATGTTTDENGMFQLTVDDLQQTLEISFVGYQSTTVPIGGRTQIEIELEEEIIGLEDVVVTAIGLERDRRTIGYSITRIDSEDLVSSTEANLGNLLQGQVSGVNVAPVGGGPGASTRITIRGASSFTGDNQPLYVVDGIPIDNENIGSAGKFGGFDGGDGIQHLNPGDIEDINVLKGASAAALYGERARDGVILISTRQGRAGQVQVNFSSNTTFEQARVDHLDYQTEYGQGDLGRRPQSATEAWETNLDSWGEPFDGSPTIQWDGVERPYQDLGSQLQNLYRTGISARNEVSVTGGVENATYYFSASRLDNQGIIEDTGVERTSLTFRGNSTIGRLNVDVKANYIDSKTDRKGWLSDTPANVNTVANQFARNVPVSTLRENFKDDEGREIGPSPVIWEQNPYWIINEFENWDERNRLIGHSRLNFELADWVVLTGRIGLDFSSLRRRDVEPWGTAFRPRGRMADDDWRILESNTDVYLDADYALTPAVTVDAVLGGALRYNERERVGVRGSNFTIPGLHALGNTENISQRHNFREKEVRSVFGSLNIGYNDYLFLNLTGRNDWSSTLPPENNSFFYPSIGVSYLFSEMFDVPEWLSHGQLRATWAEVGSDTDPFMLQTTFNFMPGIHLGQPLARFSGSIPSIDLRPTKTQELELGFDIRFFDDRLGIDFAWYDRETTNQILRTDLSPTTGFGSRVINVGQLDNTGFEWLLTAVPVVRPEFFWRSRFNFGRNVNRVVALVEGQELLTFEQSRRETAWVVAEVGEEFGTIRGFAFERDADGNIVHEDGLPVQGELTTLGRGTPDWTAGWSNTLSWRNFSLNALVDIEWGGQLFAGTNANAYRRGLHQNTLLGRAECDETRGPDGRWAPDCFVYEGVDINGGPNTTGVTPQTYFNQTRIRIGEEFIEDRNIITMRQLRLTYTLPPDWLGGLGVRSASVALTGRNLFFIYNPISNVDPEASINRGNAQGLESDGIPQTRTIGFNIDLQF